MKKFLFLMFLFFLVSAAAHEITEGSEGAKYEYLSGISTNLIIIASAISLTFVIIALTYQKKLKNYKVILFLGIIIPIIIISLFLAGSTVYLNTISESKGPVHWHADFEIWACGEKVDLVDPTGLSNRIGSPVLHEHGDLRIHVEGVLIRLNDADLHSFFEVIGGDLTNERLVSPTDKGVLEIQNGDMCNGLPGVLQVFVYQTEDGEAVQKKIADFEEYVLSPYSNVPPGDCIIIEFDEEKEETDKICTTYKLALEKGDLIGG